MSFALLKNLKQQRIPLVRYSARTKRENRLTVQLLKDFPQYGVKGQIIEVLPGLMRNRLYPNNGACYIIPKLGLGPRIPVVTPQKKQVFSEPKGNKQETIKPITQKAEKVEEISPISIRGLLLDLPEGTEGSGKITAADSSYSLFTLELDLSNIHLKVVTEQGKPKSPVTKKDISKQIGSVTGIIVPESDILLLSNKKAVEELVEVGEYTLVISKDGKEKVTKKVVIGGK